MGVVRFELATTASLNALNDRAERLGHGRPFGMEMSPSAYFLALGGIIDESLTDMERRLALDDAGHRVP